ncbi:cell wall biogenesis protein [Phytophthora boehmeriae]|uniref:Cell wall biogenesis protein n=1 Tax=Phytophthora boehmeriae TaxID=109152 RepID=A0A8T1WZN3_9STRA|nr:cell wall biogenesis protein [Phytophthora boehmeriae]
MGNSDSKSKFRESVYKLNNEIVSAKNLEFWDKLWRIPTVAEEIFTLIQPDDVRMLRHQQPENLATMLRQAVSQLVQIVDTPVPKYYQQALNCVRVLARLVPFILEESGIVTNYWDEFVENLFWSVDNGEKSEEETKDEVPTEEPLAKQMIHAIMGLLFLPEFTVSIHAYKGYGEERRSATRSGQSTTSGSLVFPSLLWHAGVGYPDANVTNTMSYDKNRREVLALLLTCFSSILYQTAETCNQWKDRFLEVATAPECPFAPTLFYSLLNIVVSYDPVGWGVPYAGSLVSDDREMLVDISLQVLLVLLDFGQTSESHVAATSKPQPGSATPKRRSSSVTSRSSNPIFDGVPNVYRNLLAALERPEDFKLIFTGLSRLLNNYHESMNTLLPNSVKQIKCHQELLVLLWKMLDENTSFLQYVLKKADVNQLVVPLLFLMYEGRQEPVKVGMIHICTFILLLLSGERDFGVNLNKPFNVRLPLDLPPFSGNHADLLIVCLHKIIVSGYEKLNSVYNCFLTIICNISPYCKKLNMVSSVRLLRLFKLFAQPRYLFDNEANHHLVFFLLETFDNIIQYQYEGNQQVVYAMIQNKNVFYQLNDLQLPPIRAASAKKESEGEQEQTDGEFVPTAEWLTAWKKKLPLTTSLRLLQHLIPQLDDACKKAGGSLDEDAMLYFLRTTTMVGLLPVPHPIVIRKYQINQFTHLWFTTFTWGVIFLRNQVLPLFDGEAITLFTISVLQ